MVMVTDSDKYCSRYSIPRTLPYFSNFNPNAVTYKHYYDIEGNHIRGRHTPNRGGNNKSFGATASKRLHIKSTSVDGVKFMEKGSGNIKSISVNDILDQHLSRLTLRNTSGGQRQSKSHNKSKFTRADLDSAGSVDSILTRQAQAIEKGNILRKKEALKPPLIDGKPAKRLQLEPSIVTLVHISHGPGQSRHATPPYHSSSSVETASPLEQNPLQNEQDLPDYIQHDIPVQHQETPPLQHQNDLSTKQQSPRAPHDQSPILEQLADQEVRHSYLRAKSQIIPRVGENPKSHENEISSRTRKSILPHQSTFTKRRKKSSKNKVKTENIDTMKGFGPWVTEPEVDLMCSFPRSRP